MPLRIGIAGLECRSMPPQNARLRPIVRQLVRHEQPSGRVLGMSDWRVYEPENLFPAPGDAAWYLAGLSGFWGGLGGAMFAPAFAAPSVAVAAIAIVPVASIVRTMMSVRK